MIKDRAELIVHRLKIDRRIRFSVFIAVFNHLVLPGDNLLGCDLTHSQFSEIGQQFGADDMLLGRPGIFLQTCFHVGSIKLHKALEGHIQVSTALNKLFPLP